MLYIPNQPLDEYEPTFPYSWTSYKKVFSLSQISVNSIIQLQREQIKDYSLNNNEVLEMLNNELQSVNTDFSNEVEVQVVQNIERNLQGLRRRFEEAEKSGIDFNSELNNLLNEYQNIIGGVLNLSQLNYKELNAIGKSMYKLQTDINLLRNWLNSSGESGRSFAEMAQLRIANSKTQNAHFVTRKTKKTPSLLNQLAGIGTALKGLELEKLATKKVSEKIPDVTSKYEEVSVVNTGAIRVQIFGNSSVNIKEDISIFDMAFSQSKIQLVNGEVVTLQELLNRIKKSETVVVSAQGYEQLQAAMISAVSSKSTQLGKKIQLHAGLTADRILSEAKPQDMEYWSLKHLHQIKKANSNFRGDSNYISILINYNMSKMLTKIIGLKNDFLVTKQGFMSMKDYLEEKLNEGRYVAAATASLDKAMIIQI